MRLDRELIVKHLKLHRYPYAVLMVLLLFSIPILGDLIRDWYRDGNYSHGFFIIPISIFLFYRKRHELKLPAKTSRWGMVLFVAGCVALIFGYAASEYFTTRVGLIMILTGFAWYYLGADNFKKSLVSFFLFAVHDSCARHCLSRRDYTDAAFRD